MMSGTGIPCQSLVPFQVYGSEILRNIYCNNVCIASVYKHDHRLCEHGSVWNVLLLLLLSLLPFLSLSLSFAFAFALSFGLLERP